MWLVLKRKPFNRSQRLTEHLMASRFDHKEATDTAGQLPAQSKIYQGGLYSIPVEDLAILPDYLVPPTRMAELDAYRITKRQERMTSESEADAEADVDAGSDLAYDHSAHVRGLWENPEPAEPQQRIGPRGGKYTEAKTKDGRPYRRYF
jgi:hypothetical protein